MAERSGSRDHYVKNGETPGIHIGSQQLMNGNKTQSSNCGVSTSHSNNESLPSYSRPKYGPADYYYDDYDDEFDMEMVTHLSLGQDTVEMLGSPNKPIRVVPSITDTAGLDGKPFDYTLDCATKAWFEQFNTIWKSWKKSAPLIKALHEYFSTAPNPYLCALKLFLNCNNYNDSKPKTLPYIIIEELGIWSKPHAAELRHNLTKEIQYIAFSVIKLQRNIAIGKLVNEIFRLSEEREMFLDSLKRMVSRKEYREACQWSMLLGLHDNFTFEDFVLPLFLQDKHAHAEEFLDHVTCMQRDLVAFLDSLLEKTTCVRNAIEPILSKREIPDVKYDKLHHKPLGKLVARLCKKYSLPPEVCQNLNLKRNEGAVQFLLHKRYIEQGLGLDSWREMLEEALNNNKNMQRELLSLLVNYGDSEEALRWAKHYAVPTEFWPYSVRQLADIPSSTTQEVNNEQEENWDESSTDFDDDQSSYPNPQTSYPQNSYVNPQTSYPQNSYVNSPTSYPQNSYVNHDIASGSSQPPQVYHTLMLPPSRVVMIDTVAAFEDMLYNGFSKVYRIGLDAEWKPYFGTKYNDIALIQLATGTMVFLLDVVALGKYNHLWQRLASQVFNNEHILKLGYGLSTDLDKIKKSLKLSFSIITSNADWIDLQTLTKVLNRNKNFRYPFTGEPGCGDGLSALVQLCLGTNLDKANQFSNWEQRPLRQAQIDYAALDAHCLLEVHDIIIQMCNRVGINLEETCDRIAQENRSPKKRNKKRPERRAENKS